MHDFTYAPVKSVSWDKQHEVSPDSPMPVDFDELPPPVGTEPPRRPGPSVSFFPTKWWLGEGGSKGLCLGHSTGRWEMEKSEQILRGESIPNILLASFLWTSWHHPQIRKHVWKAVAELEPGPSQPDTKGHSDRTKRSFANSLAASTRTTSRGKRKPQSGFWGLKGSCSLTRWALRLAGIELLGGVRDQGTHEQDSRQQALTFLSWKNHYLTQFRSHAASA